MRQDLVDKSIIALRRCETSLNHAKNQPVFVFLCGGDAKEPRYICRNETEQYLRKNQNLSTIVCVRPEILLKQYGSLLEELDLLELEAFIAEVSDAVLLYDESPGTVCELGAFAMSDPIWKIMTAAIPEKHKNDDSFIINGPVRHMEKGATSYPLSSVIYLDINCPFSSIDLAKYFHHLRENVAKQSNRRINKNAGSVNLNSLCREYLDLISVFAPLSDDELIDIYKRYKDFDSFVLQSNTFSPIPKGVNVKTVIAFLSATGLVEYKDSLITMTGRVPSYFMFNASKSRQIAEIRAQVLAAKRRHYDRCDSVYFE